VFGVLTDLVKSQGLALLMATHNHDLARRMSKLVEIRDGVLI
jgi:lipoprotein-releasing system ATP-binding protein